MIRPFHTLHYTTRCVTIPIVRWFWNNETLKFRAVISRSELYAEGNEIMWVRILIVALGTFAIGTDSFVMSGILPTIAHDLNITVASAGLMGTVFSITYALCSPILATATSNLPRKRLLLLAIAIFTLGNILAALAPNFAFMLFARVVTACGAALFTPTAAAAVAALVPAERRGQALSIVVGGQTVSIVLGVPLGIIISSSLFWRGTFWFIAVLGGIALVGLLALFPNVASPPAVSLRQRLAFLRQPAIVVILCTTFFWMIGAFTVYTYLGLFLQQITHVDGSLMSVFFLGFGLLSVVGNMIGGFGADRWGARRTIIIGLIGLALALFMLPWIGTTFPGMILDLGLWGATGWMVAVPQQHRLIAAAPSATGVVLSLNASVLLLGNGLGAAFGGLILRTNSVQVLGWAGGVWAVVALGTVLVSIQLGRRNRMAKREVLGEKGQIDMAQV
jgi:DHA1 family inner membrane transport protein